MNGVNCGFLHTKKSGRVTGRRTFKDLCRSGIEAAETGVDAQYLSRAFDLFGRSGQKNSVALAKRVLSPWAYLCIAVADHCDNGRSRAASKIEVAQRLADRR